MKTIAKLFLFTLVSTNVVSSYALANTNNSQQNPPTAYTTATNTSIKGWANEAFMAAYGYDFVKYNEELSQASKYFTPDAWKDFKSTLDKSGIIELIKNKQLISAGLAEGTGPVILQQGTANGSYTWNIQFPGVITYTGPNAIEKVQHVMVNMTIISTTGNEGVRGLAIEKMNVNLVSEIIAPPGPAQLTPGYKKALETAKPEGSGNSLVNVLGVPQSNGKSQ